MKIEEETIKGELIIENSTTKENDFKDIIITIILHSLNYLTSCILCYCIITVIVLSVLNRNIFKLIF